MNTVARITLSVAVAYAYALAAWPILRTPRSFGRVTSTGVGIVVLFCPLLVPSDGVATRALVGFLCIELMCKMIDYARQCWDRSAKDRRFVDYLWFLIPFPSLLVILGQRERQLTPSRSMCKDALRALGGGGALAGGFLLLGLAAQVPTVRSCFPLDHGIKLAIFVVAIEGLSQMVYGLERLVGFDTTPLIDNGFLSRTVGEFWCRYNTRIHTWLDYSVFRPSGGRRSPVRGVLLTFFVSALFHELMFGIATSRFDGYQFTFFMLQAPAVLASRPLRRFASRTGVAGSVAVVEFWRIPLPPNPALSQRYGWTISKGMAGRGPRKVRNWRILPSLFVSVRC